MPDQRKPIEIQFPFKGIDETRAYRRQPEMTTPFAVNVRPFDGIEHRLRGGQRDGHANYIGGSAVNGTNPIQAISQVTTAWDASSVTPEDSLVYEQFTQTDGVLATTYWYLFDTNQWGWPPNCIAALATTVNGPIVKDNAIDGQDWAGTNTRIGMIKTAITPGSSYIVRWTCQSNTANAGATQLQNMAAIIRAGDPSSPPIAGNNYGFAGVFSFADDEAGHAAISMGADGTSSVDLDTDLGYPADFWATSHVVEVRVFGDNISVWIDDIKVLETTTATLNTNTYIGFGVSQWAVNLDWWFDDFAVYTGRTPASGRSTKLVAVSGGRVYHVTMADGASEAITAAVEFRTSGRIGLQECLGNLYGCDGIAFDYNVYDPLTHNVDPWIATAGCLPVSTESAATAYTIDGVNVGASTFTISGDGDLSALLPVNSYIEVAGTSLNDGIYRVAGIAYAAPAFTITVAETIPDATVEGTISKAAVGCNIIALYRGRVVMSGLHTDPQNWFMSAVGDPLDWDYSPATTSATMAVAGVNTDAGKLGDIVTALIPYSDDLMIIGGDHTVWIMRGDPADGGVIDNISYQTGIAGPDAFTWDPAGNLYFFGAATLWRMGAGVAAPEDISRRRMHDTFLGFNYDTHRIRLLWDNISNGVHIYVTPSNQPDEAGYHFYWDQRTDSLWADEFPLGFGPTAVWTYDADDPDDRAMILGGFDSRLRYISESSTDDSTAITSSVIFTPIIAAGDLANIRLTELTIILAEDSDPISLSIYANESAQAAFDDLTPLVSRTLQAGRNSSIRQRVNGNSIIIALANASTSARTWALESMTGLIKLTGKTRKGRL